MTNTCGKSKRNRNSKNLVKKSQRDLIKNKQNKQVFLSTFPNLVSVILTFIDLTWGKQEADIVCVCVCVRTFFIPPSRGGALA